MPMSPSAAALGPAPMTRPLSVAVAGLGTVGGGVLKLLRDNADVVTARAGRPIAVTAVSARDRTRDRGVSLSGLRWYEDPVALAADPAVEVVVELIGGSDGPARALVQAALAAGKPVVTANKAMLAVHGASLAAAAEEHQVPLAFEAAVAGGIPVIKALREGLAANRILRIAGILNGTCNYILTQMRERGREFAEVLADAQKLGYAEADPSFDIDGIDAAHKLAIFAALSAMLFGCSALTIATGMPTIHDSTTDSSAISAVSGPRRAIISADAFGPEERVAGTRYPIGDPDGWMKGPLALRRSGRAGRNALRIIVAVRKRLIVPVVNSEQKYHTRNPDEIPSKPSPTPVPLLGLIASPAANPSEHVYPNGCKGDVSDDQGPLAGLQFAQNQFWILDQVDAPPLGI